MARPIRKSIRLKTYDYNTAGAYFVTICTNRRRCVLSKIVGALREAPLPKRSVIAKIIGYLKMNVSKQIHVYHPSDKVWQRLYYDHVIRNDQDYQEIWEYIDNNPMKWRLDRFYRGDTQ